MSFVLTRFKDVISVNKEFGEALANELRLNQFSEGTMLLVARKVVLESSYTLNYNSPAEANFPGQYNLVIVADELQSKEGEIGRIDLSGRTGRHPPRQRTGENGRNADKEDTDEGEKEIFAEGGGDGTIGDPGGKGRTGSKIKLLSSELGKIEVIANGGVGGKGGTGGNGGKGGDGAMVVINHKSVTLPPAPGGDGAMGGIGGNGGDAGTIEGSYCKTDSGIFFQSIGGAPGEAGEGGEAGKGGRIQLHIAADGHPGGRPNITGSRGPDSTISVNQVEFSELWQKVVTELDIPHG